MIRSRHESGERSLEGHAWQFGPADIETHHKVLDAGVRTPWFRELFHLSSNE